MHGTNMKFDCAVHIVLPICKKFRININLHCKEVKNTTSLLSIKSVVNKTICFDLLGGHHQVQQLETNIFHGIERLDAEISSSTLM